MPRPLLDVYFGHTALSGIEKTSHHSKPPRTIQDEGPAQGEKEKTPKCPGHMIGLRVIFVI